MAKENKGEWKGWADFLGYVGNGNHAWTKQALISYLEQARNYIHVCSIPQLLTIIESNGLFNFITKEQLKKLQSTVPDSEEREQVTEEIIKALTNNVEDQEENTDLEEELTDSELDEVFESTETLEVETGDSTEAHLKALRELENDAITASLDDERVQFLVSDSINNLWYDTLDGKIDISKIENLTLTKSLPNTIKEVFLSEYDAVNNIKVPEGWCYPHEPLLMQKLISYKLKINKRFGNWSGAGAGKTIGAILAGGYVGAKNTLIITFNSTIGSEDKRGWTKEIRDSFPKAKIHTKINKNVKFDNTKQNYLILNYETFQQRGAANYVIDLLQKNKFDYIILDEVHSIKQRTNKKEESKRREVITGLVGEVRKVNPDYYLLAMSATPVINNLNEAKSLIELITFKKLDDINTTPTISNCIELFRRLVTFGIRHKNIEDNILKNNKHTLIEIDGNDLFEEANRISADDVTGKELLVLNKKLEAIAPYINTSLGKTVIYTHYTTGLEEVIYDFLTNLGFKVCVYTGGTNKFSRESAISDFIDGKYDVFLGSRPIGTGVDGLQKVSDREIILSLPWTNAELYQLEKRVNRKGSNFKETGMDVIIPIVSIGNGKKFYNWDKHRYDTVMYKATIANAAVDGIIPERIMPNRERMEQDAVDNMDKWIERLRNNDILTVEREELETGLYPDITDEEIRRQRINSDLMEFYRRTKITRSDTMHKEFLSDPKSWFHYHALRNENIKDWEEIPFEYIATKIRDNRDVVVDFGCGENKFKNCIPENKVWSFDHVAIDEDVTACDMKDVSQWLVGESVDVAVFSLALWGVNYPDYIAEAFRVLRFKGMIYIAEPISKYATPEEEQELIDLISNAGFKIVGGLEKRGQFVYISGIKI